MEYKYEIDGTERSITIDGSGDNLKATLDGEKYDFSATLTGDGCLIVKIDGKTWPVRFARDEKGIHIAVKGKTLIAVIPGESGSRGPGDHVELVDGKQILVAPMPGQVVKVNVKVGDAVTKKQCLVIVEAMKMENELITAIDGTVTAVHVEAGKQVGALQPLVEVTQTEIQSS